MPATSELTHIKDLWDEKQAAALTSNQLALLQYRSNLLGADLRITNFGAATPAPNWNCPIPSPASPSESSP